MKIDVELKDVNDDRLGREPFATQIANGIVNSFSDNHESLVIGINGQWGAGKSTLVNFVVQKIEDLTKDEEHKPVIIRFNPWMFSGQKELQTIFLGELYNQLNQLSGTIKQIAEKVEPILNKITWVKYIHSGAGEFVKDAKKALEEFNKTGKLSLLKKELNKSIEDAKLKIYITIDDIDRLTPNEVTEIFQLVKLNANFANTVFILCYDYDVVVSALKSKFGDNGEKYLEKIVQVDYTLPKVSQSVVQKIFIEEVEALFPKNIELTRELKEFAESDTLLQNYFQTLRDVYRFINAVKLRLEEICDEVNIKHFMLVEALRIFDKSAYEFIPSHKESLMKSEAQQVAYSYKIDSSKVKLKEMDSYKQLKSTAKLIINELFNLGNEIMNYSLPRQYSIEKGVFNKYYFDNYFSLSIPQGSISEKEYQSFIEADIEKKIDVLKHIEERNKTAELFTKFGHRIRETIVESKDLSCLEAINIFIDRNLEYYYVDILRESPYGYTRALLKSHFIKEFDGEIQMKYVEHLLLNKSNKLFITVLELVDLLAAIDKYEKGNTSTYSNLFYSIDKEKIDDIKNKVNKKVNELICFLASEKTIDISKLCFLLKISDSNCNEFLNDKAFENEDSFLKFLTSTLLMGYKWTSLDGGITGYRVIKGWFKWSSVETIKKYIDKNIDIEKLEDDNLNAIKLFLQAYKDNFNEKIHYDFYTQKDITAKLNR